MKGSWKTSASGISVILLAISTVCNALFDNDPNTIPNWNIAITQVSLGVGLLMARDNNKSSEDVGNK